MKYIWFLNLFILIGVLMAGCDSESDLVADDYREEIVVYGYLYIDEPIDSTNAIFIGKTKPVLEYYQVEEAAIENAHVTLQKEGSDTTITLHHLRKIIEVEDELREVGGYYANPNIIIEPLTTYYLEIEVDDKLLTAQTTTPHTFDVQYGPKEIPETMGYDELMDSYPILLTCDEPEQIFMVDVYCEEDWEDARFINPIVTDDDEVQDFDQYGGTNGEPRHIFAYFRIKGIEDEQGVYDVGFYRDMVVFYGHYSVNVMSIDDNYYNYLYREHPELSGGINGGLGVFGSALRADYRIKIVE